MMLERNLTLWEAGELGREELLERNADAAPLVALFERLASFGAVSVPDPEVGWTALRDRLPEQLSERNGGERNGARRWFAKPLLAAAIVVGLTGGAALASPAVRHQLTKVWHSIQNVIARDHASVVAPPISGHLPTTPAGPTAASSNAGSGGDGIGQGSGQYQNDGKGDGSGGDQSSGGGDSQGSGGGGSSQDSNGGGSNGSGDQGSGDNQRDGGGLGDANGSGSGGQ